MKVEFFESKNFAHFDLQSNIKTFVLKILDFLKPRISTS